MMKKVMIGAAALISLAGATIASSPANAYPWHGGWHGGWGGGWHGYGWRGYGYRGYGPGAVLGAGVLSVAVGASLAHPYYGAPPAYYAGPGYWGYYGGCRGYWRWDPRFGRYERIDRCY